MAKPIRPLDGIRVLELGSLTPAPFGSMILADFGADVILIEKPGTVRGGVELGWPPLFSRGKRSLTVDLKTNAGRDVVCSLAEEADVFIEGFRAGVAERLGLGPADLMQKNPRLIYTRVSGWGQDGPMSQSAGHDINYLALGGVLAQVGIEEPVPPGTFVGDFGAGPLFAVIGILLALQARQRTGAGQIVDAAIVDGVTLMMEGVFEMARRGQMYPRGLNMLDGHAPFYGSYQCADGRWFAVGAIEPKFYAELLAVLGISDEDAKRQMDRAHWPRLRQRLAQIFMSKSRAQWIEIFSEADACGTPVLDVDELSHHPHLVARQRVSARADGGWTSSPSPLLSATPAIQGAVPAMPRGESSGPSAHVAWNSSGAADSPQLVVGAQFTE